MNDLSELERKRPKVVAEALVNKTARIAWALLTGEEINAPLAAVAASGA